MHGKEWRPMGQLPIIDGHNDTLLRLYLDRQEGGRGFLERSDAREIDLPRAQEGGLAGGFFAIFVPEEGGLRPPSEDDVTLTNDGYTMPLAEPIDFDYAQAATIAMMARLYRIESASLGAVTVVKSADELEQALRDDIFAMILHIEGAEAIDPELDTLEVFYRAGLRSLGLVWSRPNAFGEGVPYRYPRTPDTGPGLTAAGRDLVRACNRLGVLLDLSHLNERGFWDVAKLSDAPLVATHSNAHALCPSTRNLTDRQLDAIRDSDGMVGVAFDVTMLRPDGWLELNTPLGVIVDHIDYLVERIGIDRVGFGSDFDGAAIPTELKDVAGLPKLIAELRKRGYDEGSLRKLASENWVRVLRHTWKEA
jgi:membrane dipeptidase